MKKILLLTGVACLLGTQANAIDITPYVSAKLKYSMMEPEVDFTKTGGDKFDVDDKVFGGAVAVGLSTKLPAGAIRTELEYNKSADAKKTHAVAVEGINGSGAFKVETHSFMLNGYYDFDTNTQIKPYIGAGIGYTKLKSSAKYNGESLGSMDDNTFTWQIGAGIGYQLNDNVTAEVGYRYVDYGDFKEDEVKLESKAHEIMLGLRYTF